MEKPIPSAPAGTQDSIAGENAATSPEPAVPDTRDAGKGRSDPLAEAFPQEHQPDADAQPERRRQKRRKARKPVGAAPDSLSQQPLMPPAAPARRKPHHVALLVSFLLLVMLPLIVATWYLYARAADQYASVMGFSVRKAEGASASELFGGFMDFGQSASSDSDILYEFIQSQGLVERIDARLDLRTIYARPEGDPVFAIAPDASIETLLKYWKRMVTIDYDPSTGLIETRALAFTPQEAQAVNRAIFEESSATINLLSKVAREDTTRYAREELALAEERLRAARTALTEFRARTQLVDPNIDIQGQMGLLNNLQAQLAEALIDIDMLQDNTRAGDPRLRQAEQRIAVIERRIAEERKKFGIGETASGTRAYASLVGEYESLAVDREFAEQTYLAALAGFDAAQAEAQRKARYLAAYASPTLAESAEYPRRLVLLGLIGLFSVAIWAVGALVFYSLRDRR